MLALDRRGLLVVTAEPFNAESPSEALGPPLTPVDQHYIRSHFPVPDHDGVLRVGGAVDRPMAVTIDGLRALPATTLTVTLECAGNGRLAFHPFPGGEPWSWNAVGTATWTGVPLQEVLARAGVRSDGTGVLFEGADHGPFEGAPDISYARSMQLADVERWGRDILIAYAMNGEPLTPDHGAPIRLVVPGWYAMASVKWLRSVRVISVPFEGAFQSASYVYHWPNGTHEPVTDMRVRALVTDPVAGSAVAQGRRTIRGKAWSGGGTVSAVEVGIDGERTWHPASIGPPAGPHAWQEWELDWVAPAAGRHLICARARDSSGAAQPDFAPLNALGYGNNAVHPVIVDVR